MQLLDDLKRTREDILTASGAVPPERRQSAFVGHWSIREVLAHLAGWDYTNIEALEEHRAGQLPSFYTHYDPDWATFNERLVERYGQSGWEELIESVRASQAAFLAAFGGLSEEELRESRGLEWRGHRISMESVLRAALRDEREHLRQVEAFLESVGGG